MGMAERRDVSVTVEDDEPHRISLELEEEEDEEPFVMETEELRSQMDKSHMPEVRPFDPDPDEDAVWASRDPGTGRGQGSGEDRGDRGERRGRRTGSATGPADPEEEGEEAGKGREAIRQEAFERVADRLREKGRSEEWIEGHEDVIWERVDEILTS